MKNMLKESLLRYISENYPEMAHQLNPDVSFSTFLDDKVNLVEPLMDELIAQGTEQQEIIAMCIEEIVRDFAPSKYHYLVAVLEEEFPQEYDSLVAIGILQFTVLNMVEYCKEAFEAFDFGHETIDDRFMRYMIIAEIHDYLLDQNLN